MKKIIFYLIGLFVITSCSDDDEPFGPGEKGEKAARTLFAYIVSNNSPEADLDKGLKANIGEMYYGLAHQKKSGKLLVFFRPKKDDPVLTSPTILEYEADGKGHVNGKSLPKKLNSMTDPMEFFNLLINEAINNATHHPLTDKDMVCTQPDVMMEVIGEMRKIAPADRYGIMFSSHGSGWMPADHSVTKSFGDDNGHDIDIADLRTVLKQEFSDTQLDFVLFDACLMGAAEVCYELRDVADYCVGSTFVVPGGGFPYQEIMGNLFSEKINYQNLCDMYAAEYADDVIADKTFVTCSAVQLNKMDEVAKWVKKSLEGKEEKLNSAFYKKVQSYFYVKDEEDFIQKYLSMDLVDFFLQMDGGVSEGLLKAVDDAVVAKKSLSGKDMPIYGTIDEDRYCGLGMYVPYIFPELNSRDTNFDEWYMGNVSWYKAICWEKYKDVILPAEKW